MTRLSAGDARQRWPPCVRRVGGLLLGLSLALMTACSQPVPKPAPAAAPAPAPADPSPADEFRAVAARLNAGSNRYLGMAALETARAALQRPNLSPPDRFGMLMSLAHGEVREGQTAEALAHVEEAGVLLAGALAKMPQGPERNTLELNYQSERAIAYLRHAENRNCIARHCADSCILPIKSGGVHVERAPAQAALEGFVRCCRLAPDDLGWRWLANLAALSLGEHPKALPRDLVIPASALTPKHAFPHFKDVGASAGVNSFSMAGGVAIEDFDGDGDLDIITSSCDPEQPLVFYRNRGDGMFDDAAKDAGLADQLGGLDLIAGDYDNDGDQDILVLRGAWLLSEGLIRKSLLRNDGGRFIDVTRAAGLAAATCPSQAATWGDFDLDGDLDLYVGCEAESDPGPAYPAQLFRNGGDGTFVEIAKEAGVTNDLMSKSVAAGDHDNDGDLDLYVSNIGPNRLYRNDGGLRFTDVAQELSVTEPAGRSFSAWFFDVDNDGWLDLWVAAYEGTLSDFTKDLLGQPQTGKSPRLYMNRGGTFVDEAASRGLAHPWRPMGANFGDVDNDGWLDIYLGTGDPEFRSLMPNVFLRSAQGQRFDDVTLASGLGHLQKGHGVAFADLDEDGDEDVYHQLGGFVRGDRFSNTLFENPGFPGHFVELELNGTRSAREGRGARIRVDVSTPRGKRSIHRCVGAVSSFGGSPIGRLHVGLGDATAIERIEIKWPLSAEAQVLSDVPLDSRFEVTEAAAHFKALPLRPTRLGGAIP